MLKINSYIELVKYLEEDIDTKIIFFNKEEKGMKGIGYVTGNEDKTELFLDKEFFFQHKYLIFLLFLRIYQIPRRV